MKLYLLILLLVIPFASATYETTLLTVSDDAIGGTAHVSLEVKPGSGRIFMDSYPITKADTQFSTRFANEVACDFLRTDCSRYDFFYTIRAESAIVGGPSAGAAMAVLTVAALDGQPLRQDVAMTGTINSGGVIGPVAGIIPKSNAAFSEGLSTVVVPSLVTLGLDRINTSNVTNVNTSSEYDAVILANLSNESFRVVQAGDLYDALPFFIDKEYPAPSAELVVPESYADIMSTVADVLCERRDTLLRRNRASDTNRSTEISESVAASLNESAFYSAASFCFTQNIELREELLSELRPAALRVQLENVKDELFLLDSLLEQEPLATIGDVETHAIVRERIVEAAERMRQINSSNISVIDLAFVIERTFSARVWADFFAMESALYSIDLQHLRAGCVQKISEAEERITYVEGLLPEDFTVNMREQLDFARRDFASEEFSVCLFKASKAKAEANTLASTFSVSQGRVDLLVEQKLAAVERVLARQAELDLFPIMGYSYFEYAQSLAADQPYSALTFAEYSLELSNLHVFFPREDSWSLPVFDWEMLGVYLVGLLTGFVVFWIIRR